MLENHGHHVVTYIRNNSEIDTFSIFQKAALLLKSVYNGRTYNAVRKLIKKENISLVHVHNTLPLISPAVFYACRDSAVPVFQTVHNFRQICLNAVLFRDGHICTECIEKGFKSGVRHKCYRGSRIQSETMMRTLMAAYAHGIYRYVNFICLTEFNRDMILKINDMYDRSVIDFNKVFIKPNFVPEIHVEDNADKIRHQFIYIGRIGINKGTDVLFEAWKEMPEDYRLIVCGEGDIECSLKNVELMGQVQHDQVMHLLAASEAMIFLSRMYEGFPMTIVESFAAGTPVIGLNHGNGGDLLKSIYGSDKKLLPVSEHLKTDLIKTVEEFDRKDYTFDPGNLSRYSEEENYKILMDIYHAGLKEEQITNAENS